MKIVDLKDVDVVRCKRFYKHIDNCLQACNSFKAQKNFLLKEYDKDSFQRDFLIRRKIQLKRISQYDYGNFISMSMNILLPFIGSCLIYFNDIGHVAFVFFLVIAAWNVFLLVQRARNKLQEPEIRLYEIRKFELILINNLLKQDKEDINLYEFVKKVSGRNQGRTQVNGRRPAKGSRRNTRDS